MIKAITVRNFKNESLRMELSNPDESEFVIMSVTGIGAGEADIATTDLATMDGSFFNSARMPSRNIVLSLRYWPVGFHSVEDIRQLSYRYFPLKKQVYLTFETDNRMLEIGGYVESNDPNIFSNEEGSDVSVVCPNPYFYAIEDGSYKEIVFYGVEPAFHFPFSNESLSENLLKFGNIIHEYTRNIYYDGDADTGCLFKFNLLGAVGNITIEEATTHKSMVINASKVATITGNSLRAGDQITIDTVKGQKKITLTRSGVDYNILNSLNRDAEWFQLTPGDNIFSYTASSGAANTSLSIAYRRLYQGV